LVAERSVPRPFPKKIVHEGVFVLLEPLDEKHLEDLWDAAQDSESSWTYLRYGPFKDKLAMLELIIDLSSRNHQPFWVVINKATHKAEGWLSLCDVYPDDSAIEVGSIWFSKRLQRTRQSTEAIYILMKHGFDELGYQRFVWRCLDNNLPSRLAAERYGFKFEGIWRSGAIIKGITRDLRWHSMLNSEWPSRKRALERWLSIENFDEQDREVLKLKECV
jgi:RimJ/RimL family protein N-acetyltransferase